jgi:hypothetical protein
MKRRYIRKMKTNSLVLGPLIFSLITHFDSTVLHAVYTNNVVFTTSPNYIVS